ncbi:glucosaminidase domain-containing protein [Sphingobacterium bovistauri]|uniref:Peptidoglycan hydrolase n=1 Tax=Sphingobacterium bovistauri TaxID=2781959 RepID=A0ABS7ZB68_9SPHI|nr:glucosaminidase domain-containing protein [Sphingobacterium bovistauri]MCA5006671.1 glucosaminidase domain-containing protein [Sphingobacterium bovistauri]
MRILVYLLLFAGLMSSCASKRPNTLGKRPEDRSSSVHTTPSRKPTSITGLNYIERYKGIAVSEMEKYGIPASIKLAQALLESGNGNSSLAIEANNHFGIKCGGVWKGKSITKADDNPNDCFRVYENPEQSFRDHSEFLLRKRYEKLFSLNKNDYKGWAYGLKEAGYATNPRYPELLIDLIERYELYKYDSSETKSEKIVREVKVETTIVTKEEKGEVVQTEQIKAPVRMVIHEVKAGNTLYSIGRQYNVSVDQIKQLNNLSSENLSLGQLLVISK